MNFTETSGRFVPGQLLATPGVLAQVSRGELMSAYARHLNCDWGDVPESDKRANNMALRSGARLLSAYTDSQGTRFWIITEADRSATTFLLPEEY